MVIQLARPRQEQARHWSRSISRLRVYAYTVFVYDSPVIRSFADDATEHVFYDEATKAARRLPKVLWPVIRRKLDAVHAARALDDLRAPPGNRLEALKGDQAGRYSIRVNDQGSDYVSLRRWRCVGGAV